MNRLKWGFTYNNFTNERLPPIRTMISAKYYASALSSKKNYSHASLSHLMTLQTLRSKGTIPYTKIGHKIWYLKRDIERILRSNYIMFNLRERYGEDI